MLSLKPMIKLQCQYCTLLDASITILRYSYERNWECHGRSNCLFYVQIFPTGSTLNLTLQYRCPRFLNESSVSSSMHTMQSIHHHMLVWIRCCCVILSTGNVLSRLVRPQVREFAAILALIDDFQSTFSYFRLYGVYWLCRIHTLQYESARMWLLVDLSTTC